MGLLSKDECWDGVIWAGAGAFQVLINALGGPIFKFFPPVVYWLIAAAMLGYGGYKLLQDHSCLTGLTGGIGTPLAARGYYY
jgi:hypothetical protein